MPATLLLLVLSFVLTAFGTALVRAFALRRQVVDVPNERSSHVIPTPRGGGLSIVVCFQGLILASAFLGLLDRTSAAALLSGGTLIALIGLLDDFRSTSAKLRIVVHIVAALLVVGLLSEHDDRHFDYFSFIVAVLSVFVLVWATNLFNFMDGIDGIATLEAIFICGAAAALSWDVRPEAPGVSAVLLCISCLGFLPWNWPRARIFMGDVGSGFLGFQIAVIGVLSWRSGTLRPEVWLILSGVFVADTAVTLIRRMARGDRWFEAHRLHAYQHLSRRWHAHLPVTFAQMAVNICWLLPWAWVAKNHPAGGWLCAAAALVPVLALTMSLGSGQPEKGTVKGI